MRVRPGPNLLWHVGCLTLLGLGCFLWPAGRWLVWLLLALAAAPAYADYRFLRRALSALGADRTVPVRVALNASFDVVLRVRSAFPRPLRGSLRDEVPCAQVPDGSMVSIALPAGGSQDFKYSLRIDKRGLHGFERTWIRLRGPFGYLEGQKALASGGEVKVVPQSIVSRDEIWKDLLAERQLLDKIKDNRWRGQGMEFDSLAEFRDGDDLRRIDWRASAKHSRLVVRRFQLEQHRDLFIALDCGRLMGSAAGQASKLDCAVDSALLLARVALQKGDRCGVGVFDDRLRRYRPPLSGSSAFDALIETLYDVQSQWRESNFLHLFAAIRERQLKRSLIVILSDVVDMETSERYREALASLSRRHLALFVALRTPLLDDYVGAAVESALDVSRQAVVFRTLREREKALHALRRSGVHVLDVTPSAMTIPLLNKYIALRERNLL